MESGFASFTAASTQAFSTGWLAGCSDELSGLKIHVNLVDPENSTSAGSDFTVTAAHPGYLVFNRLNCYLPQT